MEGQGLQSGTETQRQAQAPCSSTKAAQAPAVPIRFGRSCFRLMPGKWQVSDLMYRNASQILPEIKGTLMGVPSGRQDVHIMAESGPSARPTERTLGSDRVA